MTEWKESKEMTKKEVLVKIVSIRSQLVMLCQRIDEENLADRVEGMIPAFDEIISSIKGRGEETE